MKNLSKLLQLAAIITVANIVFGAKSAHAATLNVVAGSDAFSNNGQCQLSEAIQNINNQAQTNPDCLAGNGNNDTINLPSGTITFTQGVTAVTQSLKIIGTGKSTSIINSNGNGGIVFLSSLDDFEVRGVKIINATNDNAGIGVQAVHDLVIDDVEIDNCSTGIYVSDSLHTTVSNSYIHNNISSIGHSNGLSINVNAVNNSDIPSVHISDTKVSNNQAIDSLSGVSIQIDGNTSLSSSIILERSTISGNSSQFSAGVSLKSNSAQETYLKVDSVTVSNNVVQPTVASVIPNPFGPAYSSGFNLGITNISDAQNFSNVTVANNTSINTLDDHLTIAGFFGLVGNPSRIYKLVNTTVVGNNATQTTPSILGDVASFYFLGGNIDQNGIHDIFPNSSAQNTLVANNLYNGVSASCRPNMDGTAVGLVGLFDLTPINLGNNITDDPNCTGYTVVPNLSSTLGPLQDNGGSVETIALLPGSPAIAAGGVVLGISTDARGIARPSTPDVGAYQTVLGATTSGSSGGSGVGVPNSGLGGLARHYNNSAKTYLLEAAGLLSVVPLALILNRKNHAKTLH